MLGDSAGDKFTIFVFDLIKLLDNGAVLTTSDRF
jgi:hypothetical protein